MSWGELDLSPYAEALAGSSELELIGEDGRRLTLDIQRYLADADADDETVLGRVIGPVLDVGCGPGRIVHALVARGIAALGVDVTDVAVELSTGRGAPALMRSVFDPIPGEGRWPTVLMLDGNIGIGGDVDLLLRRLVQVMSPTGQLIVEISPQAQGHEVLSVRFGLGQRVIGSAFDWAVLDRQSLLVHADQQGLAEQDHWSAGGRVFVRLVRIR